MRRLYGPADGAPVTFANGGISAGPTYGLSGQAARQQNIVELFANDLSPCITRGCCNLRLRVAPVIMKIEPGTAVRVRGQMEIVGDSLDDVLIQLYEKLSKSALRNKGSRGDTLDHS